VGAVGDIAGGYSGPSSVVLESFSSLGPTDDGRVKPDVVANGFELVTPHSDGDFDYSVTIINTGTSFAPPTLLARSIYSETIIKR
jgi:hypothetical protein